MFIAGIMLLLYNYKIKNKIQKIKISDIKYFIYLSLYNIYLNSIFEIWGLNNLPSSKVCLIYSLSPFITAIIAFFILKEKLNLKKFIGISIGFLGLLPIIYTKNTNEITFLNFNIISFSELSIICAVTSSVLGWIFLKKIINLGYSFILANGISMLLGGTFILMHSYIFSENWTYFPVKNWSSFIIITLISTLISNIICYNLFGYLLKSFSTTFMTFAGLITPFFASLFGFVFLSEIIYWNFLLSIILFLTGLIIFYKEEIK